MRLTENIENHKKLHRTLLFWQAKHGDDAGDVILDEMDVLWRDMSDDERAYLNRWVIK